MKREQLAGCIGQALFKMADQAMEPGCPLRDPQEKVTSVTFAVCDPMSVVERGSCKVRQLVETLYTTRGAQKPSSVPPEGKKRRKAWEKSVIVWDSDVGSGKGETVNETIMGNEEPKKAGAPNLSSIDAMIKRAGELNVVKAAEIIGSLLSPSCSTGILRFHILGLMEMADEQAFLMVINTLGAYQHFEAVVEEIDEGIEPLSIHQAIFYYEAAVSRILHLGPQPEELIATVSNLLDKTRTMALYFLNR